MRRTTDPLDSPADTGPTLPIAFPGTRSPPNPDCRILPPKRFSPYSFDYGNGKTSGKLRN
ncbi:hypothetical protein GCM10010221_67410 [Streptomyces parvus]|nr:hypothetical protein GCM10010221_67410 [Streptomyces parvus]